jgi:hypothetical protein
MGSRLAGLLRPALVAAALGCHNQPGVDRPDGAAVPLAAGAASAPVPPARAAQSPRDGSIAAPAALDAVAVRARVDAFFAQFRDGTDFEFLRAACESPVERFVTAEHADIGAVIASSARFFHAKRGLKYTPDDDAMTTETLGDVTVARLPLTMTWATTPPAAWDAGLALHQASVDVEIAFAPDGRIRRYVEGPEKHATLRATGADSSPAKDGPLECRATGGGQTVELFLTWEGNVASGSLRTTQGDGGFATRAVKAELYKGLVLVNPAGAPDPGSRIATVQEPDGAAGQNGKKMIQVGDWRQPWLPCGQSVTE